MGRLSLLLRWCGRRGRDLSWHRRSGTLQTRLALVARRAWGHLLTVMSSRASFGASCANCYYHDDSSHCSFRCRNHYYILLQPLRLFLTLVWSSRGDDPSPHESFALSTTDNDRQRVHKANGPEAMRPASPYTSHVPTPAPVRTPDHRKRKKLKRLRQPPKQALTDSKLPPTICGCAAQQSALAATLERMADEAIRKIAGLGVR